MEQIDKPVRVMTPRFNEAFTWAASLHRQQARKGTDIPYVSHLMAVSALVLEDGGSEDEAIAGLLHDAPEDLGAQILLYISAVFGEAVAAIVEGCSDDLPAAGEAKRPWLERKVEYLAHLAEADDGILRVSAADKLHNARATATDLRRAGWPASKACRHRNLWYYNALRTVISERLPDSRTAQDLSRAVDELFQATPTVEPETVQGSVPPSCGCSQPEDSGDDLQDGEIDVFGGPKYDYLASEGSSQEEADRIIAEDKAVQEAEMRRLVQRRQQASS